MSLECDSEVFLFKCQKADLELKMIKIDTIGKVFIQASNYVTPLESTGNIPRS